MLCTEDLARDKPKKKISRSKRKVSIVPSTTHKSFHKLHTAVVIVVSADRWVTMDSVLRIRIIMITAQNRRKKGWVLSIVFSPQSCQTLHRCERTLAQPGLRPHHPSQYTMRMFQYWYESLLCSRLKWFSLERDPLGDSQTRVDQCYMLELMHFRV